jgi:tyrosyl-tRNA synthetase
VEAAETARRTFEQGGLGEGLPTVEVARPVLAGGIPVVDLLVQSGLAASKGEARRLIKGGGARINDAPVAGETQTATEADLSSDGAIKLSAGRKRHALVRVAAGG